MSFLGRHVVFCLLLGCTLLASAMIYSVTHHLYQQLNQQLHAQAAQLKQLEQYRLRLSAPPSQPTPSLAAETVEWHLAQWAEELGLNLTLTRDKQQQRLSVSLLQVDTTLLKQYLQRFLALAQPHTHQRLSLQRHKPGELQFNWLLSGDLQQHAILTEPEQKTALVNCQQSPLPASLLSPLPSLTDLRLAAIVTDLSAENKRQAYFRQPNGNWLAISDGGWLQNPLTQVTAINEFSLQLQQWRQHQGCWHAQSTKLKLED